MNQCHFLGRMVRDPELRSTNSGKKVVNFAVAVNHRRKGGDGEVSFLDCEAWDTGAETIAKYFCKGDPIIVHCSLRTETWEGKEGERRSKLKFRVNSFEFVPGNRDRDRDRDQGQGNEPVSVGTEDSDIPF